jgi:hydroxymethylbilane synthase
VPILRLGTRGSALARQQTQTVAAALAASGVDSELVPVSTTGDRDRRSSLLKIGGQGVFVRAIEEELRAGRIDIAVHSAKDVPTALLDGTSIAACLPRGDVRDVLISDGLPLAALPDGARVGTGSRRRMAQLRTARPSLALVDIRGNVDTRLRKLAAGEYDALVLAAAGLQRLGRDDIAAEFLPIDVMLPAPGQAIIALQIRSGDASAAASLAPINDAHTSAALQAERAVLETLGEGCTLPVGALARARAGELVMIARVLDMSGEHAIGVQETGPIDDPEALGRRAGERLLVRGARELLQEMVS